MKILLMGVGMQGRAALFDLVRSTEVEQVIAVDMAMDRLLGEIPELGDPRVSPLALDADDTAAAAALMARVDAVIHLLPTRFRPSLAKLAVTNGCHFVDASYADPELESLADLAAGEGVAILPEFGLDPGIDLVLAARGFSELDEVHKIRSYGAGIPEKRDNPLDYKISWTFKGVLSGYTRPARLLSNGEVVDVPGDELFLAKNVHQVTIEPLGSLEAYPNGDAVRYLAWMEDPSSVREAGRYSLRWPGHSEFWRRMVSLGFLEEAAIETGGRQVSPRQLVHDLLQPRLQYGVGERDIALVRVELEGRRADSLRRLVYQVIDYADLESGLTAMQRTVGFTAAIGARMILRGEIKKRGLLNPLRDVPSGALITALKKRGIRVERQDTMLL